MMPFRKILFPIDFPDATTAMVPYVTEMAQRFNATVTLLNAFNLISDYNLAPHLDPMFGSERVAIPYAPLFQDLRKEREQHLEEFARTQFSLLTPTVRIEDGDPARVIEWVAEREKMDLIMMATKGSGKFRRMLLGSIAAKVLHDLSCPIFMSAHEPHPATAWLGGYRSIVCAVELNAEAEVVLRAAGLIAQAYRAKVCLLHLEPASAKPGGQASAQLLRDAFEKALDASRPETSVDTTVHLLDAAVPEGIRRTAIEETADLVIVGRGHQKGSVSRMWSHLYSIIRESPCPVLSV
jgi:nucleotide-binding universal stress UspA family protein